MKHWWLMLPKMLASKICRILNDPVKWPKSTERGKEVPRLNFKPIISLSTFLVGEADILPLYVLGINNSWKYFCLLNDSSQPDFQQVWGKWNSAGLGETLSGHFGILKHVPFFVVLGDSLIHYWVRSVCFQSVCEPSTWETKEVERLLLDQGH